METQVFYFILAGGVLIFVVLIVLFLRYSDRGLKKGNEGGEVLSIRFSKEFSLSLERLIKDEIKKNVLEINKEITKQTIEIYKKEISDFAVDIEKRLSGLDEVVRDEISKLTNISSKRILDLAKAYAQARDLMLVEAKKSIEKIDRSLDDQIKRIYQEARDSLSAKMIQTEKEIEEYKKERLKEIGKQIFEVMNEVAKKTLGRTIDIRDHEDFVWDALEKAKREIFYINK